LNQEQGLSGGQGKEAQCRKSSLAAKIAKNSRKDREAKQPTMFLATFAASVRPLRLKTF
jgi:hypothetical protein